MEKISKEKRSRIMASIKSKDTGIELILGRELWAKGYRYRKNNKAIPGTPDFTIKRYKLAIFCDGDFWHGKNWEAKKQRLHNNREFWIAKIERNMARDMKVNKNLGEMGWIVLRFWENDIRKEITDVITKIELTIYTIQKSK